MLFIDADHLVGVVVHALLIITQQVDTVTLVHSHGVRMVERLQPWLASVVMAFDMNVLSTERKNRIWIWSKILTL